MAPYASPCVRHARFAGWGAWTCLILSWQNMSDPVQVSQIRYEEEGEHKTYF